MNHIRRWLRRQKRRMTYRDRFWKDSVRFKAAEEEDQDDDELPNPDFDLKPEDLEDIDDDDDELPFPREPFRRFPLHGPGFGFRMGDTLPMISIPDVRMDWYEDAEECVLEVELPGVKRDAISIRVEDELLLIEADLPERKQSYHRTYLTSERQQGHLSHTVTLHNIRKEGLRASLQDGVLTITMPRKDPVKIAEGYEVLIE